MSDPLFEAAVDFLKNGGDLPTGLRAEQRFKFTAAALKQVHDEAKCAKGHSQEVEDRLQEHLIDAEGEWKELKTRLNLVGSLVIIASAIIALLAAIGII
jgi:hypothetical protein